MAKKQEIMFMDKGFMAEVIDTLKFLDVRGYESNRRRTIITMELERALNTNLPLEINQNEQHGSGDAEGKAEKSKS